MADDNILQIGALVDLTGFTPGLETMVTQTSSMVNGMTAQFQQLATSTLSSTAQMTTAFQSVPASLQVIPPAIQNVETKVKEGTTSMWESFKELTLGVREEGAKIVEVTTEIGAKISETAERSRLGIGTMESGFAGLAGILGAGIAVGFAADFLDEIARVEIELGHLNVTTQISIETLSGLRNVAQQSAVPFESLQVALARMQRAQVEAIRGSSQYVRAFKELGISIDELKTLKPEDLFFRLADGIGTATAPQIAMNSGITIMGRGVYTLIPLLEKYGTSLRSVTEEAARQSGITEESVKTAEKWHEETAKLSQMFQAAMVPVLQAVVNLIPKLVEGFDAIGAALLALMDPISVVLNEFAHFGKIIADIFTHNWSDLKVELDKVVQDVKDGAQDLASNLKAVRDDVHGIFGTPPQKTWFDRANQMMQDLGLNAPKFDLSGIDKTGKNTIVQQFREQLDQMRDAEKGFHELSKNEEAQFWASKLSIVKGNVQAFRQVYHEFVTANRAAKHEELADEMKTMEQRLAVYKTGSQQRIIVLEEELNYLKRVGAEETNEFKSVQEKLIVAQREANVADQAAFVKHLSDQIAAAGHNVEERNALVNSALWFAINTYGIDSEAYKKALEEKLKSLELSLRETDHQIEVSVQSMKAHLDTIKTGVSIEGGKVTVGEGSEEQIARINQLYHEGMITFEQYKSQKIAALQAEEAQLIAVYNQWRQMLQIQIDALEAGIKAGQYTGDALMKVEAELDKLNQKLKEVDAEQAKMTANMIKQLQQTEGEVNKYSITWQQFLTKFINQYGSMKDQFITGTQQMFTQFANGFANAIAKSIVEGKNFGAAMAQIYNQMLINFIAMLARMVEEMIIKYTIMKAIQAVFGVQTDNSGLQAQQQAAQVIAADTARSEADVFMQAIETVPFPANLAAAPAAASAVGVMMSAISAQLGKAEKGALLPHDMLLQAHANELVIPSGISSGLQNVVAAGGFNPPPAATAAPGSLSGFTPSSSSTINHTHNNTISPHINVSVMGSDNGMKDMHNKVVSIMKKAVRNGVDFGASI